MRDSRVALFLSSETGMKHLQACDGDHDTGGTRNAGRSQSKKPAEKHQSTVDGFPGAKLDESRRSDRTGLQPAMRGSSSMASASSSCERRRAAKSCVTVTAMISSTPQCS